MGKYLLCDVFLLFFAFVIYHSVEGISMKQTECGCPVSGESETTSIFSFSSENLEISLSTLTYGDLTDTNLARINSTLVLTANLSCDCDCVFLSCVSLDVRNVKEVNIYVLSDPLEEGEHVDYLKTKSKQERCCRESQIQSYISVKSPKNSTEESKDVTHLSYHPYTNCTRQIVLHMEPADSGSAMAGNLDIGYCCPAGNTTTTSPETTTTSVATTTSAATTTTSPETTTTSPETTTTSVVTTTSAETTTSPETTTTSVATTTTSTETTTTSTETTTTNGSPPELIAPICDNTTLNKFACDNEGSMTIECTDDNVIKIIYANYGRLQSSTEVCPTASAHDDDTNCVSSTSFVVMFDECNGEATCTVSLTHFEDECQATYKYLEVHYQCLPTSCILPCACDRDLMISVERSGEMGLSSADFANVKNFVKDLISLSNPGCEGNTALLTWGNGQDTVYTFGSTESGNISAAHAAVDAINDPEGVDQGTGIGQAASVVNVALCDDPPTVDECAVAIVLTDGTIGGFWQNAFDMGVESLKNSNIRLCLIGIAHPGESDIDKVNRIGRLYDIIMESANGSLLIDDIDFSVTSTLNSTQFERLQQCICFSEECGEQGPFTNFEARLADASSDMEEAMSLMDDSMAAFFGS